MADIEKKRSRKWFIEINPGAGCYDTFKTMLEDTWAYILHDKDITDVGEAKLPHYHLYIKYNNARSFTAMKNKFEGAHIEPAESEDFCIQYLTHRNDKDKYQYEVDQVVSNMTDIDLILMAPYYETFKPGNILGYINEGCSNYLKFYERFGPHIQQYTSLINAVLRDVPIEAKLESMLVAVPYEKLVAVLRERAKRDLITAGNKTEFLQAHKMINETLKEIDDLGMKQLKAFYEEEAYVGTGKVYDASEASDDDDLPW